jgi:aconitase B
MSMHKRARVLKCQVVHCVWVTKRVSHQNQLAVSTSTRNFPNRLGQGANVYLASAELASVAAVLGKLPTKNTNQKNTNSMQLKKIDSMSADIYKILKLRLLVV